MKIFIRIVEILGAPNNPSQTNSKSFSCKLIPASESQSQLVPLKGLGRLEADAINLLRSQNNSQSFANNLFIQPNLNTTFIQVSPNLLVENNTVIWTFDIEHYDNQILVLTLIDSSPPVNIIAQLKLPLTIFPINSQITHSFSMHTKNPMIAPPKILLNIEISNANPFVGGQAFMAPIGDVIMAQPRQKQVGFASNTKGGIPKSLNKHYSLDIGEVDDEYDDSVSQSSEEFPHIEKQDSDHCENVVQKPTSKDDQQTGRTLFFPLDRRAHNRTKRIQLDNKRRAKSLIFDSNTFKRLLRKRREMEKKKRIEKRKRKHRSEEQQQNEQDSMPKAHISYGKSLGFLRLDNSNIFLDEAIEISQSTTNQKVKRFNPFIQAGPGSSRNLTNLQPRIGRPAHLRAAQSMDLNPFVKPKNLHAHYSQSPQLLSNGQPNAMPTQNIVRKPVIKTKAPLDILNGKPFPIKKS